MTNKWHKYAWVPVAALMLGGCIARPGTPLDPNDPLSVLAHYEATRSDVDGAITFLDIGKFWLDGLEASGDLSPELAGEIRTRGTNIYFRLRDARRDADANGEDPARGLRILESAVDASALEATSLINLIPVEGVPFYYRAAAQTAIAFLLVTSD